MSNFTKQIQPFLLLALLLLPLFFLNMHTVHSTGGDDYAQYIKEAQNLATGKPYWQSNYVFNAYNNCYSPPQYPPGFPLLLAPVVKIWGIAILPMCWFNTVVAVCIAFCLLVFFRRYTGLTAAFCLTLLITYSGIMLDMKQMVLADETSLLFVMLYLITRSGGNMKWYRVVLLIIFAVMAVLIRTQSVLLLFAEVFLLFVTFVKTWVEKRKMPLQTLYKAPALYVVPGTLLISYILNKVVFPCPHSALGFYVDFLRSTLQKGIVTVIRDNINSFVATISSFFHYETENSIRTAFVTVMEDSGLVLCIIGFGLTIKDRLHFDDVFFVMLCGLMLYYPIHDPRYFLPAIALVYYYNFVALRRILPALTHARLRYVGIGITAICLWAGGHYFKTTLDKQPYGYGPAVKDVRAFDYLSKNVSDSDIIVCARPRLITLYTNKRCMVHAWQYPMNVNKRIFDSLHVKYILMDGYDYTDNYYHNYINSCGRPVHVIDLAEGYRLFVLRP